MSSLKQQLKKIGTLDLRNVTEGSRKTRPSFLFTPREAADQDLETIYSIAYNGIMELVILDEKFAPSEKTLFSEKMKSVDRVLQVSNLVNLCTFFNKNITLFIFLLNRLKKIMINWMLVSIPFYANYHLISS